MRRIGPLLALLWLCACDTGKSVPQAEDDVRAQLRDPGSAEFSEIRRREPTESTGAVICGKVNARNGFGGMTGPKRFISGAVTLIDNDDGETASAVFDGVWNNQCL